MDIFSKEIGELARALDGEKTDLYLAADIMPDHKALVNTFCEKKVNNAVFLPGPFTSAEGEVCFGMNDPVPHDLRFTGAGHTVFADIRLLGDEEFRAFLLKNGFFRFILPFAECADEAEYGFRRSYAWIGEMRGETEQPVRVTALFSAGVKDLGRFRERFGSTDVLAGEESRLPGITAVLTENGTGLRLGDPRYAAILQRAERSAFRQSAVFFSTRREAREFIRCASFSRVPAALVTGETDPAERKDILNGFSECRVRVLAATKTLIPSSLFFRADDVYYCGLPYSFPHASRTAAFSREGIVKCFYSENDHRQTLRLIASGTEAVLGGGSDIVTERRIIEFLRFYSEITRQT